MKISKLTAMGLLIWGAGFNTVYATDYCPSPAQISAGQFNGWEVYIVSNGGASDYAPATQAQIQQLESIKHPFLFANWSAQFLSWGVQNAICIYNTPNANYLISRNEQPPSGPTWTDNKNTYTCGANSVKLCPFNQSMFKK